MAASAPAATYYVDATGGLDANDGVAPATAWKTLNKINTTAFQYGDCVLLKRGEVWSDQQLVLTLIPGGAGSDANRLTIGTYGAPGAAAPLIVGGGTIPQGAAGWVATGINGEYRFPLCATAVCTSSLVGVVRAQPAGHQTYRRIEHGTAGSLAEDAYEVSGIVGGIRGLFYKPLAGRHPSEYEFGFHQRRGIQVTVPYVTIDGIDVILGGYPTAATSGAIEARGGGHFAKFANVNAKFSFTRGINLQGVNNAVIENSTATYNRGTGLYISTALATNATIRNSESAYNGALASDVSWIGNVIDRGGIGIQAGSALVEDNFVHDNGTLQLEKLDAEILVAQAAVNDTLCCGTIRRNSVFNAKRSGIQIAYNPNGRVHPWNVSQNIVDGWAATQEGATLNNSGVLLNGGGNTATSGSFTVLNNTIYSSHPGRTLLGIGMNMPTTADFIKNSTVRNNLVFLENSNTTSSFPLRVNRDNLPGTSLNYDLAFGTTSPYQFAGTNYSFAAAFFTATGHEKNGLNANPLLTNPASGDFAPLWFSPAIDAGTDVGLTTDFYGNPIYGAPDIGAIEFQPPYTMGTDPIDIAANIRVYGNGKYRHTAAPSGSLARLSIAPQGGFPAGDYREFMDLAITQWGAVMEWRESSAVATTVVHTIDGLTPLTSYVVKVDGAIHTVTATDSSGTLTFGHTGGGTTFTTFNVSAGPGGGRAAPGRTERSRRRFAPQWMLDSTWHPQWRLFR